MALSEGGKCGFCTVLYERGINSRVRDLFFKRRAWCFMTSSLSINENKAPSTKDEVQGKLPSIDAVRIMSAPHAGVAKLVYALDSKSSEVHSSCRFESDLRHQTFRSGLPR